MAYNHTRPAGPAFNPLTNLGPLPSLLVREGRQVKVKLTRSLYFGGVLRVAGETVTVSEFDAMDLRALGRAELAQ